MPREEEMAVYEGTRDQNPGRPPSDYPGKGRGAQVLLGERLLEETVDCLSDSVVRP